MLILASNSPRRRQLLALGGWDFIVEAAHVDESVLPGEAPPEYVRRLAESKARAVAGRGGLRAGALVVAADTTVVDGTVILGKPADAQEAAAMLRSLRGRAHQVYTGLAVMASSPGEARLASEICVSEVVMRDYSEDEMLAYIASGDPLDKAGAYAIQHAAFRPVERLQGCYANVMGLPVCQLARMLTAFGAPAAGDRWSVPTLIQSCQALNRISAELQGACEVYRQAAGAAT